MSSQPEVVNVFSAEQISDLSLLLPHEHGAAVSVYQESFRRPPYEESFTREEAHGALQYIIDKAGHLVIGKLDDAVVSVAGGYLKGDHHYYIEELAVRPDLQGHGLGRKTLQHLLALAAETDPRDMGIRTNANNTKAINLYESEGFVVGAVNTVTASRRDSGNIALDERVHLIKQLKEETMEKEPKLSRVVIAYPSGNTTAVVFDQLTNLDDDGRKQLNDQIMNSWKVQNPDKDEIEQCCFITHANDPNAIGRVEMFGGEFCGNATRTGIWLLTGGADYEGIIEASGVDRPLAFTVKNGEVSVEMPFVSVEVVAEGSLVELQGITHLVVTDPTKVNSLPVMDVLDEFRQTNKYGLTDRDAFGITYFDKETKASSFGVYVKKVDTCFDETACGSGTGSIGAALAAEAGAEVEVDVIQPTGEVIKSSATYDADENSVTGSRIAGEVRILFDGEYKLA